MMKTIRKLFRRERATAALRRARRKADQEIKYGQDDAQREAAIDRVARLCDVAQEHAEQRQQSACEQFSYARNKLWRLGEGWSIPYVITELVSQARPLRYGGFTLLGIEGYVSSYVLRAARYDWLTTLSVSGLMTLALAGAAHGVIKLATDRDNPRESAQLIRKWVCLPSLIVTLPSLALFLFVRVFSGGESGDMPAQGGWFGWLSIVDWVLYLVSSVFDFALWAATLGLVPLGTGLLMLAGIYSWSQRYREEYEEAARQKVEWQIIRAEYEAQRNRPQPPAPPMSPRILLPPPEDTKSWWIVLLAVGLATGLTACQPSEASGTAQKTALPAIVVDTTPTAKVSLSVRLDKSGSLAPEAAEEAARTFHRQLPGFIQALQADELDVRVFGAHGWHTEEIWAQSLPKLPVFKVPKIEGGKLPPHIVEQMQRRAEEHLRVAREQAEKKYQTDLQQALAGLDVSLLNAATKQQSRCTDLLGVLARIGASEEPGRQVYVIITDGYFSCKQKAPVREPMGNVTVLVMLATAVASESQGRSDADQYYERKAALLKIAPWLIIVPADEPDLLHKLTPKPSRQAALAEAKAEPTGRQ